MRRVVVRPAFARQSRGITTASEDGVIAFQVMECAGGIHVERAQDRARDGRVVQSMRFRDDASFVRWCEADRLKFIYPLLFANLRRTGSALFAPRR